MKFKIDQQTLEELNLLGRSKPGSVQQLFSRVKSRAGEQLLDRMFKTPLIVKAEIENRINCFRFFQHRDIIFPFDSKDLSELTEYFSQVSSQSTIKTYFQVFWNRLLVRVLNDTRFKKELQALHALVSVLQKLDQFLPKLGDIPSPMSQRIEVMRQQIQSGVFRELVASNIYEGFNVGQIARYQQQLRGRLSKDVQGILSFIAELDVYIAVSNVARERNFTYPIVQAAETNIWKGTDLRHPAIEHAVGNDFHLGQECNLFFLTGANMAGKSTWMKTLGISLYLAHMGFPVAAKSYEFSVREGMYSSINVADNVALGYSHFYSEVIRVKQAAEAVASGARLVLFFDELFKGTNVKDAFDGTLAVTRGFARYRQSLFMISTHIIEVGEELKELPGIQFGFMPTIMNGHRPQYTYTLKEGITEDRQGMMIIRNEGILDLI
ncbi:MutS-related protein [Sphingobacterium faecale]|uniref:DNA mismatch repair protein n=1 Tax=Sphingobacterium faecale TaxID=2803775 RepID=A0ABS1R9I9_9SPHI|nr:DNA mismatch repair protein [Sphingobacterium faecale]MBL1411209.1 DNA mismatch repair protein [Sphingobacterium faecale]